MITIHAADAADFSGLGLGALTPAELEIEERAGGMYELRMKHPMDEDGKWWSIAEYRIIRAPAPMRETPLLTAGAAAGSAVRQIYEVNVSTRLRLRTAPSTENGRIIGRYRDGTRVIRTGTSGDWYQVIVQEGGASGWMHSAYLNYVGEVTEAVAGDGPGTVIQPRQTRDQLFRITQVERDEQRGMVSVTAQHIFYDLAGCVVTGRYAPENAAPAEVCAALTAKASSETDFSLYCTAQGTVSGEYGGRSLASALLEKDVGVVPQTGARIIRDNFDVFILKDEQRDRGVQIRHGKNLTGAVMTVDASAAATRIVPIGRDREGEPLYLDGSGYVDSPRAAEIPVVRARAVEYDVCLADSTDVDAGRYATAAEARARLRELALADFAAGADAPQVSLDVDFVALEQTAEYARYAGLQSIHLYDTVRVIAPRSGINASLRMTGYVWDGLANGGKGRYKSVTLGDLQALETVAYGYDIADGTLSGTKVINGTLSGAKLRNASIQYAKINAAAIEQLSANAITALIARIGEISAGKLTADELYAAFADVIRLAADSIAAGEVEADRLAAALAEFVTLQAGVGKFDLATVQNLLAGAFTLEKGVADSMMITNLAVTSANLLSATLGKLVLRGEDGGYYHVFVGTDGVISTEEVELTEDEIGAGQTSAGAQIVETSANIAELNAQSLLAHEAVIGTILTDALTAGSITAADAMLASATIPALYTTTIRAIGNTIDISANDSILMSTGGEGLSRLLRLDADGLHVGVYGRGNELLLDEASVNVLMNNQRYSRFAANYVQFGNYQLRKSADGGLVFKLKEE